MSPRSESIRKLLAAGWSTTAIRAELGCSHQAIQSARKHPTRTTRGVSLRVEVRRLAARVASLEATIAAAASKRDSVRP